MTLADLAHLVAAEADFDAQWRLVVEFLKEYHQEPAGVRLGCLYQREWERRPLGEDDYVLSADEKPGVRPLLAAETAGGTAPTSQCPSPPSDTVSPRES